MAIKSLELENFKGQTANYNFGPKTIISGRNGSGKSSIRDATAFAFCGTDSYGTRNPTHLISKDKDALKVVVTTDKATISRTLTRKGSSTIKVVNSQGISSTYNQTEFENLVGNSDVFLSAMIPGYLFDLSDSKRQAVLSEVLPKVDREKLLTELMGFELTSEEKLKYAIGRRPDLVAASVAQDRRSAQQAVAEKNGRIQQISQLKKPEEPAAVNKEAEMSRLEVLQQSWLIYEKDLKIHNDNKVARARIAAENEYRVKRREEILQSMESLVLKPKPADEQIDLSELQLQLKPVPAQPHVQELVSTDHCHTCGQPVSPRYREQISKNNEDAKQAWMKEVVAVEALNQDIRKQISEAHAKNEAIKKAYTEVVETNRRTEAAKRSLELELAGIVEAELPQEVPPPSMPSEAYDRAEYKKIQEETDAYKKARAVYEYALKEWVDAASTINLIKDSLKDLEAHVQRLSTIEDALKRLPEEETKQQIGVFNTESLVFDGNSAFLNGVPLKMLSTGERLSVYEYFCREIALMMAKPHWVLFLDDKDLVSDGTLKRITLKEYLQFQEIHIFVKDSDLAVDIG